MIAIKCLINGAIFGRKVSKNTVLIDNFSSSDWQHINQIFARQMYRNAELIKFGAYCDFNIISLVDLLKNIKELIVEQKVLELRSGLPF